MSAATHDEMTDVVFGHRLQAHAKNLVDAIIADPELPPGTTAIVILCRPSVHATYARGPHWKELLKPVDQAVHEMSHDIARKRA
jgi:hypothetical protein